MATAVQMRAKGSLTIPSDLRQKYGLGEGDVFTLVDLGEGSFLLTPRVSLVPKLVAEMEAIRTETGIDRRRPAGRPAGSAAPALRRKPAPA